MTIKNSYINVQNLKLPLMEATTAQDRPTIWLTGCIHGDEVGGMLVIHEIFRRLEKYPLLKGTLKALPLLNPIGFKNVNRMITLGTSGTQKTFDLNRAFPGNPHGNPAQKIAHSIFQAIIKTGPALVLDLHNDWVNSIAHTIIDPRISKIKNSSHLQAQKYTKLLGFPALVENFKAWQPKSLSASLMVKNIPAVTIELGGSTERSAIAKIKDVEDGVKAIWDLLSRLGMAKKLNQRFVQKFPQAATAKILKYSYIKSNKNGVAVFLIKPGQNVKKGQPVAQVYDFYGKLGETIKAPRSGIILGHADYASAYPGAELISVGYYE